MKETIREQITQSSNQAKTKNGIHNVKQCYIWAHFRGKVERMCPTVSNRISKRRGHKNWVRNNPIFKKKYFSELKKYRWTHAERFPQCNHGDKL